MAEVPGTRIEYCKIEDIKKKTDLAKIKKSYDQNFFTNQIVILFSISKIRIFNPMIQKEKICPIRCVF
ncbi:hypothetical protein LEP1GSC072_3412 [Leptospira noguchii str. Bonito]|nr:hypothetical protein LEP1GSC072_3412 [Leptospira noguchii str. Bonito]